MNDFNKFLIWLVSLPGFSPVKLKRLINHFESPENVKKASKKELIDLGFLNNKNIEVIFNPKYIFQLDTHIENIYKHELKILNYYEENYPEQLKTIYDPPMLLFYKGKIVVPEKNIAIVGARNATTYGKQVADVIAKELSRLGFTIVSGLARGIDSSAHEACVRNGYRTTAVIGCGLDKNYPPENKDLMAKIINNGLILSEYLPGTMPLAHNFPQRNRIISGLSHGVIVIEAGEKSGSLITANFALEHGREVFAVPGNISSKNSVGSNKLIRDGAKIVTSVEDILEEIKVFTDNVSSSNTISKIKRTCSYSQLCAEEIKIVKNLEIEEQHIDDISDCTGISIKDLNSLLLMLELKGVIKQLPGKKFMLIS